MKMNLILVVVFAISIVTSSAKVTNTPLCGVNQIWRRCGSDCEPRCFDKRWCPPNHVCVARCMCMDGFLRNSDNDCVKFADCS